MLENSQKPQKTTHFREKTLLLGFAIQKELPGGGIQISVRWGRIVAVLLFLSATGWVGATSALYTYLKYRQGFEAVSFTDALFLKRSELRRNIGDHNIQESTAQFKAKNYNDAIRLLHYGVARSPGNLEGRKLIAEYYEFARKRPTIAADYLIKGLQHGGLQDADYIKQMLQVLMRNQMAEKIQQIADEHLPEVPELTDINRMLALSAANSNYERGNYDQAEDYLIDYKLIESIDGLLIFSKISWDRGNRITAITKLEQMVNLFSDSHAILNQLNRYYREVGDMDKARRFTILHSVKNPLDYKTKLELLRIYDQTGDTKSEDIEIERMFEQFGKNRTAMMDFANFAAETGNIDLAKRIHKVALENKFDVDTFTIILLEAYIVSKDYANALDFAENLIEQKPEWLAERWAIFSCLRSMAAFEINRPELVKSQD